MEHPNSPDPANLIATIEKIANAYYHRAVLQEYELDDIPEALANFGKAIKLNPQFAGAYYSWAVLRQTKLDDQFGSVIDFQAAATFYRQQGRLKDWEDTIELLKSLNIIFKL